MTYCNDCGNELLLPGVFKVRDQGLIYDGPEICDNCVQNRRELEIEKVISFVEREA